MANNDPAPASKDTETYPRQVPSVGKERRLRSVRRAGLLALAGLVALGTLGLLGVRTTTTRASAGALDVTLRSASVARPGLAVPFRLTIRRAGGFDEPIEVRIDTHYLASLDENGVNPTADRATSDRSETIFSYDPPDGDVFTFWLDVRVEPSSMWRHDGATTVVVGSDAVVVDHPIWILP